MLAKLIVVGRGPCAACAQMLRRSRDCEVVGVATNIAFLERVVAHEAFASGRVDTGLIDTHRDALFPARRRPRRVRCSRRRAEMRGFADAARRPRRRSGDPHSPWHARTPSGTAPAPRDPLHVRGRRRTHATRAATPRREPHRRRRRRPCAALGRHAARTFVLDVDGGAPAAVVAAGEDRWCSRRAFAGGSALVDPLAQPARKSARRPPDGADVRHGRRGDGEGRRHGGEGAPLMVLEAMKMEHTIARPPRGRAPPSTSPSATACRRRRPGRRRRSYARAVTGALRSRCVDADRRRRMRASPRALPGRRLRRRAHGADYVSRVPRRDAFATQRAMKAIFAFGAGVNGVLALPGCRRRARDPPRGRGHGGADGRYVARAVPARSRGRFDLYARQQRAGVWRSTDRGAVTIGVGCSGSASSAARSRRRWRAGLSRARPRAQQPRTLDGCQTVTQATRARRLPDRPRTYLSRWCRWTPATGGILNAARLRAWPSGRAHVINIGRARSSTTPI
jgi:hypothetical protein